MTASKKVPVIRDEIEGSKATSQALPSASPDQFLKSAHDGLVHGSGSGGFHGAFHKLFIQDDGCSLHDVRPNMDLRSILMIHIERRGVNAPMDQAEKWVQHVKVGEGIGRRAREARAPAADSR
jgi:hypothetical protein